jgi:phospholipid-translocating ATPase
VVQQINEGKKLINASPGETFALIIDGKSLTYALEDDARVRSLILQLVADPSSVVVLHPSRKLL